MKHTPGPWHTASKISPDLKAKPREELRVWGNDRAAVCDVSTRRVLGDKDAPEELANAHLIAAAPELLAALVAIRSRLQECAMSGKMPNARDLNDFNRWADHALAKVSGE